MKKISVIVPIYKVEKYLNKCVESIVSQTYTDLEIILVDDGSPDNCPAICDSWAEKDSRIKVIHKKNGGLSDARNAGFAASSGEFISFIDSDDRIEPDFYTVMYNIIERYGCDAAGVNFRKVGDEYDAPVQPEPLSEKEYSASEVIAALISEKVRQITVNKLYRRSLIENIPFPVGRLHEDEFWSYPVLAKVEKYVESDYIGYNYYQREGSIILGNYSLKRLDAVEAKVHRQKLIDESFPSLSAEAALNLLGTCIYHGQLALINLSGDEQKNALGYLKKTAAECDIPKGVLRELPAKRRAFIELAKKDFIKCCKLRNLLKTGF